MMTDFSYSNTYILDKTHFNECFEESVDIDRSKTRFFKSSILCVFGLGILLFTNVNPYAAWFIVALGLLEALSIHYRQPWWVARQMLSKAAKGEVTITLDEKGLMSKSFYVDSLILWSDISAIKKTNQGWLLFHSLGKNYLSNRCLSDSAKDFIAVKAEKLTTSTIKQ
jgi:hypothetical protein